MRKIIEYSISILIVTFFIAASLFYFMGIAAEHKINQVVRAMASLSQQDIEVVDYKRSWFDANAVVMLKLRPNYFLQWQDKYFKLHLNALAHDSSLSNFMIVMHVVHGPWVKDSAGKKFILVRARVDAYVKLNETQSALLLERAHNSLPLITLQMLIKPLGDGAIYINSAKFKYNSTDTNFFWQGLNWHFDFSRTLNEIHSDFNFFGAELLSPKSIFKLDGLRVTDAGTRIAENFWAGKSEVVLHFLQYSITSGMKHVEFAIKDLNYQSTFARDANNMIEGVVSLRVGQIGINNLNYQNITFIWQVEKLQAMLFAEVINQVVQMTRVTKPSGFQLAQSFELLLRLLDNDATISINKLEALTPWGQVSATAHAVFKKRLHHFSWLISLLANTHVAVNVKMEKTFAEYLLQQYYGNSDKQQESKRDTTMSAPAHVALAALVHENKLLTDGKYYNISLDYTENKLLLNGQSVSLMGEK